MGTFVDFLPNFNAGNVDNFAVEFSDYFNTTYYPRYSLNKDSATGWGSGSGKTKSWLRVVFPSDYIPKKFTMSTPSDVVLTKKTPNKFKVYGVRPDYINIHRNITHPNATAVTTDLLWEGCDLLLDVNGDVGFWSPSETKEWLINPNDKKYRAIVVYMYGKEEVWTGTMEYFVGEWGLYEYKSKKDVALIKRASDNKYVSVEKKKIPYVGFTAFDVNEDRQGFTTQKNYRNIRTPFKAYLSNTNSIHILGEYPYYSGKLYFEVRTSYGNNNYGAATPHMIGWHSKYELDFVTTTAWSYDGIYFYPNNASIFGATERGVSQPYTRSNDKVDRIGIAFDLDNNYLEIFYDGVSQGRIKVRNIAKPVVPLITTNNDSGEITLIDKPLYCPFGYKNIVSKRDYEDIIVNIGEAPTVDDYKRYGIKEGETIYFDKPYNKRRIFTEEKADTPNGIIHTFRIAPDLETINKLRIEV